MILPENELQLLPSIAQLLERMVYQNDSSNIASPVTIFHAVRPPSISLRAYIERIAKYAKCNPDYFVLAIIYIDRLIQKNPSYALNSLNIHRLLITSIVLSCKYSTDFFYNNNYYATVGGVPVSELNALELEFLYLINFHLYVSGETFDRYKQHLNRSCFSLTPLPFSTSQADHKMMFESGSQSSGASAASSAMMAASVSTPCGGLSAPSQAATTASASATANPNSSSSNNTNPTAKAVFGHPAAMATNNNSFHHHHPSFQHATFSF